MSFTPRIVRSRRGNRLVHPGQILLHEWMVPCEHYWMALQADYELEKARELRELWARVGFPRAASRRELAEE